MAHTELTNRPDAAVLIVSQAASGAATAALGAYVVLAMPKDLNGLAEPLRGRNVDLWPDASDASREAFARIAGKLLPIAGRLRVVDTNDALAAGWNIAVAVDEGWTAAELIAWGKPRLTKMEMPPPETAVAKRVLDETRAAYVLWEEYGLARGKAGPYANADNVMRALSMIPQFRDGGLWFDTFRNRPMTDWNCEIGQWREWTDIDDSVLMIFLQRTLEWEKLNISSVQHGITGFLSSRSRNPLIDYLDGIKHDGTTRVQSFMTDVYDCPRSAYNDNAGRCFLVGLIARAYEPGCQLDTMIVLEGAQGLKKSSSLAILGGDFYAALPRDFGGIEFLHDMDGAWLAEIPDMSGFKGRDMEHVKAFITIRSDRFRAKYGRRSQTHNRHCVFAGTANGSDWLDDATGGRRFIPIECREINLEYLRQNRDQLLAEARDLYRLAPPHSLPHDRIAAGADWWLMPVNETLAEQAARQQDDPWLGQIKRYLKGSEFAELPEIMMVCLDIPPERQDQRVARRIGGLLKRLGYENKADRTTGKLVKRWRLGITDIAQAPIQTEIPDKDIEF
jgi:hypothetical protein